MLAVFIEQSDQIFGCEYLIVCHCFAAWDWANLLQAGTQWNVHVAEVEGSLSCLIRFQTEEYGYNYIDSNLRLCEKNVVRSEDVKRGGGASGYIAIVSDTSIGQ